MPLPPNDTPGRRFAAAALTLTTPVAFLTLVASVTRAPTSRLLVESAPFATPMILAFLVGLATNAILAARPSAGRRPFALFVAPATMVALGLAGFVHHVLHAFDGLALAPATTRIVIAGVGTAECLAKWIVGSIAGAALLVGVAVASFVAAAGRDPKSDPDAATARASGSLAIGFAIMAIALATPAVIHRSTLASLALYDEARWVQTFADAAPALTAAIAFRSLGLALGAVVVFVAHVVFHRRQATSGSEIRAFVASATALAFVLGWGAAMVWANGHLRALTGDQPIGEQILLTRLEPAPETPRHRDA